MGQVDYNTTPEELLAHFEACGTVERVTIVCDKYTGTPKGKLYAAPSLSIYINIYIVLLTMFDNTPFEYTYFANCQGFAYLEFQV